jgi:organic radical activating enzyme
MSVYDVAKEIKQSKSNLVVWTGGEPLLQIEKIRDVMEYGSDKIQHHLETNGDILTEKERLYELSLLFNYICISPKTNKVAERVHKYLFEPWYDFDIDIDIKVVTDLEKTNMDLVRYATMLMPLTTYTEEDNNIKKRVWTYCAENGVLYCARLHIDVWGKTQKK